MQDSGKFRINIIDKFYTNEDVAKACIKHILTLLPETHNYLWIEPSAGSGSFLHNLPRNFKKIGLDIQPDSEDIVQEDYLEWDPPTGTPMVVFGNPPFGRQSSLAKSFIQKSCQFADVIAFILPKSFTKPSMNNAFDLQFHLILSTELQKNSFTINGNKYDVPCVFQIWKKRDTNRILEEKVNPNEFEYVKYNDNWDIAFRRVGGLAGKCYKNDGSQYSIQSHYFIKFDNNSIINDIMKKINNHEFPSNTTGPRSLSKTEINTVINNFIEELSS